MEGHKPRAHESVNGFPLHHEFLIFETLVSHNDSQAFEALGVGFQSEHVPVGQSPLQAHLVGENWSQ